MMRQLFLVDGVDADGRVVELGCIADTEDQAIRMLATEGYDVSIRERVDINGLVHRASIAAVAEPDVEQALAVAPAFLPDDADSHESRVSILSGRASAEMLRTATLATLARDIAILDIYAAGVDVQTIARAVGASPRDVAIRLTHRALHLDVDLLESAPTPPFGNSVDAKVAGLYGHGMSVLDIAEATGLPALDVAWALMDSPARPVTVAGALVGELRAEMYRATQKG